MKADEQEGLAEAFSALFDPGEESWERIVPIVLGDDRIFLVRISVARDAGIHLTIYDSRGVPATQDVADNVFGLLLSSLAKGTVRVAKNGAIIVGST